MQKPRPRKPRSLISRLGLALGSALLMLGLVAGGIVATMSGQTLKAPAWITERVQDRLNLGIAPARVGLSGIEILFREGAAPVIATTGVRVFDGNQRFVAWVPRARMALDRSAILSGQLAPKEITIEGLRMSLRRDPNGAIDLALGAGEGATSFGGSPAEIIEGLNDIFQSPGLEPLDLIEANNVRLLINDELADRVWDISQGSLSLSREEDGADFRLGFQTDGHGGDEAKVSLSVFAQDGDLGAQMGANIENFSTDDIGSWGPSFSWLRLISAPASGAMRLQFEENGEIGTVNAALDLGEGVIRAPGTERAVRLDEGRAYFALDPGEGRLTFDEILIATSDARIAGEGQMFLQDGPVGTELITQLQFSEVTVSPKNSDLVEPAQFSDGAADFRLIFDPFRVDVGQVSLTSGDTRFTVSGRAETKDDALLAALDAEFDLIAHDDFLALWPGTAVPDTRVWLAENLKGGVIRDAKASVRIAGEAAPVLGVGFTFQDATLSFLPEQPPLVDLNGYGAVEEGRLVIVAEKAEIRVGEDEVIDASGTVFAINDVDARPGTGEFRIKAKGPLGAQLKLLDNPPFRFLTRAGQPTNIASGHAETEALVTLPLLKIVPDEDIFYEVQAVARDVRSEILLPGHSIKSDRLNIEVNKMDGLRISGRATVSDVPVDGQWVMPLNDESDGSSRLTAAVTINQAAADAFSLGLPQGTVIGDGLGRLEIDFPDGQVPQLRFFTDLNRLGLSLPPLGWRKFQSSTGSLEVLAALSDPVQIESIALTAPDLEATGSMSLTEEGGLERAAFERVRVSDWFDGPVDLVGQGPAAPFDIAVRGGELDIRTSDFGGTDTSAAGALSVQLDRLVISDSISLTGLTGNFGSGRGLQGQFSGRVNGRTPVSGSLVPSRHGTAVNMRSNNGGGVLRDSGLLDNGHGGDLRLTLVPRATEGIYDGTLQISGLRVRDAPALAELLSAVSVVGLLEQLDGGGLVFNEVSAEFVLTPDQVVISNSRAVGVSLGLTMDGSYDITNDRMDMQGVVSPVYIVNGLGQIVSRPGEGLIGISYRMKGAADNPKVRVNPLSLLTPGFLRDIFRKPKAKVGE